MFFVVPVEIGISYMMQTKRKKERKEKGGQIGSKRQMVMTKVIEVTKILWLMEIFQDVLCDFTRHLAPKCPTGANQYKSSDINEVRYSFCISSRSKTVLFKRGNFR